MKSVNWKNWGITPRVILIAMLPVVIMFLSVVLYSYYSRSIEVEEELADRGGLIASLLAESSEYGVISGNLSYLQTTITWLVKADKSIHSIDILNTDNHSLLHITDDTALDAKSREFKAPIRKALVAINGFNDDKLHLSNPLSAVQTTKSPEIIGHVKVIATSSAVLAKQQQRVLAGSLIAAATLLLTVLLGLSLALSLTKPLASTITAVRSIRRGNYQVNMEVTASGEIGELQTSIKEMADSLNQLTSDLETKVLSRTRELEDARNEAVKSNADKMRLIQQLNSAVEEERKTIAREIHDHLNAEVIAARLEAQRILSLTENNSSDGCIEEINKRAHAVLALTSNLYKIAREITRKLRPEIIDALGLCGAVGEMIRHYDALHPGCRFSFEHKGDFSSLSDDLSIAVYRLIQEALSNIVKHSGAKTALVALHSLVEDHALLKLCVSDDGVGFDLNSTEPGIGLIGMRERVLGLGGQLTIRTAPGAGTAITIEVPVCPDQP